MDDIFGEEKDDGIISIKLGNELDLNLRVQRVFYNMLSDQSRHINEMEKMIKASQKALTESQERQEKLQNEIKDSQRSLGQSNEKQKRLQDEQKLLQEEHGRLQKKLEDYNKSIITIVSLIVGIVPLLTTNLQMLSAQMSLDKLFAVNGTLMLVIGVMFFLINKVVNGDEDKAKKPWFLGFLGIGILLIIISVCLLLFKEPMQFYHVQVFKNIDSYKQK